MDWNDFCERIKKIFENSRYFSIYNTDERIDLNLKRGESSIAYYKNDYLETIKKLNSFKSESTYVYNDNEIERVVINTTNDRIRVFGYDKIETGNSEDIIYRIQPISNELLLSIISKLSDNEIRALNRIFLDNIAMLNARVLMGHIKDFRDLFCNRLRINDSVRINSKSKISVEDFNKHIKSYLFNLSYNNNIVYNTFDSVFDIDLDNSYNKSNISRLPLNKMEKPKFIYNPDLIERYNLAVSSQDPYIKFISYYQIIEYNFDEVAKDKLINDSKFLIQKPDFSSKDKKKIIELIENIQNNTKTYESESLHSEQPALKLVIEKYIPKDEIIAELNNVNPELLQYYKMNEVVFSEGEKLDVDCIDEKKFINSLSNRIYKTRNALIHNKSNNAMSENKERSIYHPANKKDKEALNKEIPLMRLIAEKIILKTAEEI